MAMNNYGCEYADLWRIYKQSPHYRPQIEHWMDLERNLPVLSWKVQLEVLENCPMDIVKAHAHLLHEKARKALGLESRSEKLMHSREMEAWMRMFKLEAHKD